MLLFKVDTGADFTAMSESALVTTVGLGDTENSALRLLQQKASRLFPMYCIVFTIINRTQHHYTCVLLVTAIACGVKNFLLV